MRCEGVVVAVDPGRSKCGIAVVDASGEAKEQRIVPREALVSGVRDALERYHPVAIVIGDRTGSRDARRELETALHCTLVVVEEHESTLHSRARYYSDHPRRGLAKLIPEGLCTPPCPLDDYAAVILGERYWASRGAGTGKQNKTETGKRGDQVTGQPGQ